MNKRQKALLTESILVLAVTGGTVVGLIQIKDYINRSEALRAMRQLGDHIRAYRTEHGSLPPESFLRGIRDRLEGAARLGAVKYRALYIGLDSPDETILAYSVRRYPTSFLPDGCVVLRLNGAVEWMRMPPFIVLFTTQRVPGEPNLPKESPSSSDRPSCERL